MDRQPDVWTQVNQVKDQPASIELHRNTKGAYEWTIKLYAENLLYVEDQIIASNERIEAHYGGGQRDEKQTA